MVSGDGVACVAESTKSKTFKATVVDKAFSYCWRIVLVDSTSLIQCNDFHQIFTLRPRKLLILTGTIRQSLVVEIGIGISFQQQHELRLLLVLQQRIFQFHVTLGQ